MRMLEVACRRCDRRGRFSIARLVAEDGPELALPELYAGSHSISVEGVKSPL